MYQREEPTSRPASVYIPPYYRGNALYLERLGKEKDSCERQEDNCECPLEQSCEGGGRTPCLEDRAKGEGIVGRILSFLGSDGAVVAAVVLFLIFSGKSKKEEQSDDILTLLLLLLVLI